MTVPAEGGSPRFHLAELNAALDASDNAVEIVVALRPVMAPEVWRQLAESWELCPVHVVDAAICRDDESECPAGSS